MMNGGRTVNIQHSIVSSPLWNLDLGTQSLTSQYTASLIHGVGRNQQGDFSGIVR